MENQHLKPLQRKATVAICLLATSGVMSAAHAELALNFQPAPAANRLNVLVTCMPGVSYSRGSCVRGNSDSPTAPLDPDKTPFYMETAVDPATGLGYYHVLLGDPNSDFVQEYYISYASGTDWWPLYPKNASGGTYNGGTDAQPKQNWTATFVDPLSSSNLSGNATGNPQRVTFRQVVKGTNFSQEVLKSRYLTKPKITQTVSDGEMMSNFVFDMSAISYTGATALTTNGVISNTLLVTDSQSGEVLTNFDINTSSQKGNINGGKYNYATGTGPAGSSGTYTYATGTYNIYSTNWAAFWDPTANIPNY